MFSPSVDERPRSLVRPGTSAPRDPLSRFLRVDDAHGAICSLTSNKGNELSPRVSAPFHQLTPLDLSYGRTADVAHQGTEVGASIRFGSQLAPISNPPFGAFFYANPPPIGPLAGSLYAR